MLSTALPTSARAAARRIYRRVPAPVRYGVPAGAAVVLIAVDAVVTRSFAGAAALLAVTVLAGVLTVDLRRERRTGGARDQQTARLTHRLNRLTASDGKLPQLRTHLQALEHEMRQLRSVTVAAYLSTSGQANDGEPPEVPARLASTVACAYLDQELALAAYALLHRTGTWSDSTLGTLRRLRSALRQRGYLQGAQEVGRHLLDRADSGEDDVRIQARLDGETAVLSGEFVPELADRSDDYTPRPGRVLHLVGRSLPEFTAGYTYRTHYVVLAQREHGLDPHVLTQPGVSHDGEALTVDHVDGVPYHRQPGPRRVNAPLDSWLRTFTDQAATLVAQLRPAVLHPASDFANALVAVALGRAFGIPVVYEARGFWEETWLSRAADQYGWDLPALARTQGLPDAYRWRRSIEARVRAAADHVVTLDQVMADHIVEEGVPADRITVVPNGVAVDEFPVVDRDPALAAQWGIPPDAVVVGYISSLVEYEGVETLISAYARVREQAPCPLRLLIVGDGSARPALERHAHAVGVDDVVFTGRVPHDQVLGHYSLIDVFVVPRRPVEVCHLVTPLKPFEAFATGRTVVLSDVRALSAIAEQSGAAETFTAGDPESLATVLDALLRDPGRRRRLADAGAEWVRRERTWAANARRYLEAYTRAGVVLDAAPPVSSPVTSTHLAALRRAIEERGPLPLEALTSADGGTGPDPDEIIHTGWNSPPFGTISLDLPVDWPGLCVGAHRSWKYRLHGWIFMGPVLYAYETTGKRHYLEWCVERALSWAATYDDGDSAGDMAWYDMSVGQRGHKLGYLLEHAVREELPSEQVSGLVATAMRHQQMFFSGNIFRGNSNHGLYVALGQLALARRLAALPGMTALAEQGQARLAHMTRTQFAADGGHREHSPGYHQMVLATLSGGVQAGLVTDPAVHALITAAEDVLGWFVTPDGTLAQIGDTEARPVRTSTPAASAPTAQFQLSAGKVGTPDDRRLRLLPESGYAAVRAPRPVGTDDHERTSYLLLAACFHSQGHKQADDLTFVWYDRGHEILIDAGRYGYGELLARDAPLRKQGFRYASPERQYVESTAAHNTVAADGAEHQRADREPYGSALVSGEERDGHFRIVAEVDHGQWRHRRELLLAPAAWLYVVDTVHATDDAPHDFRAWWNLPAEIDLEAVGDALRVTTPPPAPAADRDPAADLAAGTPGSVETLWVVEFSGAALLPPVTGQQEPLRGWRSRRDLRLTPAWSTGFAAAGVRAHTFRTLFSVGPERPTTAPDHPFGDDG